MVASWKRYCRASDLVIDGDDIDVQFASDRKHRVTIDEREEELLIRAFVARQAVVSSTEFCHGGPESLLASDSMESHMAPNSKSKD